MGTPFTAMPTIPCADVAVGDEAIVGSVGISISSARYTGSRRPMDDQPQPSHSLEQLPQPLPPQPLSQAPQLPQPSQPPPHSDEQLPHDEHDDEHDEQPQPQPQSLFVAAEVVPFIMFGWSGHVPVTIRQLRDSSADSLLPSF
mmetsp:Transcript_45042/g.123517  ORF Transcript_45042/g.123517 Transcript_45042/m.123517 type:complete len:143 (-) Transcript_45042:506-934(-)